MILLNIFVAGFAIFEIGVNCAILYRFWPEPWLSSKLLAVSGLLAYAALSVTLGDPDEWRVLIGLLAVALDAVALAGVWKALLSAHRGDGVLVAYRRR